MDVTISYPAGSDGTDAGILWSALTEAPRAGPGVPRHLEFSMFSSRVPSDLGPNAVAAAVERMRLSGRGFDDLTVSNPTSPAIDYPPDLLAPLGAASALVYDPQPFGAAAARAAVAADYHRRGVHVPASHVALTASSSESYALALQAAVRSRRFGAGPDAELSAVRASHASRAGPRAAVRHAISRHVGDSTSTTSNRRLATRTRAILVVSPNNPTGGWLKRDELTALLELLRRTPLGAHRRRSLLRLPHRSGAWRGQMRARARGDGADDRPRRRLEVARAAAGEARLDGAEGLGRAGAGRAHAARADCRYVSVGEHAGANRRCRGCSRRRRSFVAKSAAAYCTIIDVLQQLVSHVPSCQLLRAEGGWSAVLRIPHTMPEDQRVIRLLEEDHVLVHPGYFFDFPRDGYLIVSLLPRPDAFRSALERVLDTFSHA